MSHKIRHIKATEILDSRGNPTVETTVVLDHGVTARASVPSGASKGKHEAVELRDGDPKRYYGMGVLDAVANVNEIISPLLSGIDSFEQEKIDRIMLEKDGTENKSSLGANAILSVSMAVAKACAKSLELPLYRSLRQIFGQAKEYRTVTPMFNVINGGLHGNADIPFQEFMLVPDRSKHFRNSLRTGVEIYHSIKKILKDRGCGTCVGDEGGFAPDVKGNSGALDLMVEAVNHSGYTLNKDVHLSLDIAASTFLMQNSDYRAADIPMDRHEYFSYILELKNNYSLFSIEDPFGEDEWDDWSKLTKKIGSDTVIIGDDLIVTNRKRLMKAITEKACNAVLVKLNQIGSITETLEVIRTAKDNGFKVIISHRSGETTEDFIADLSVAVNADFIKSGAPVRGERVNKYNRLIKIFEELEEKQLLPSAAE